MPRQTDQANYQFPDGFKLEVSTDDGANFTDIGIVAAGATATLNWDEMRMDAENNWLVPVDIRISSKL